TPTDVYDRISFDDGSGTSMDLALELQHEFESGDGAEGGQREFWERGDQFDIEIEFERGWDGDRSLIERHLLAEIGAIDYATELTWEEERETESEFAMGLDYLRGIGESTEIELGYEGEYGWTDESRLQELGVDGVGDASSVERSGFVHRQTTHGG